jgi:hypothetical protein
MKKTDFSYEGSKWHVKLWRQRWYLYAILLHLKSYINVSLWIDYLLNKKLDKKDQKKLRTDWKQIKYHIELSKMYKFSAKYERED